jgi:hypothetical protein
MASSNNSSPADSTVTFYWEKESETPSHSHSHSQGHIALDVLEVNSHDRHPDGGLQAWAVVLGGFCCLFCSFGWTNCRF